MAKAKLERMAPTDPELLKLGTEELLFLPDKRKAADEVFRRAFNKYVKKHTQ